MKRLETRPLGMSPVFKPYSGCNMAFVEEDRDLLAQMKHLPMLTEDGKHCANSSIGTALAKTNKYVVFTGDKNWPGMTTEFLSMPTQQQPQSTPHIQSIPGCLLHWPKNKSLADGSLRRHTISTNSILSAKGTLKSNY